MSSQSPTDLAWGVKQSFRGYVEAMGGRVETGGGADRADDGGFTFAPAGGGDLALMDGALSGSATFTGSVRFEAHGGMLDVRLADPEVRVADGRAGLSVVDGRSGARLEIATLDVAGLTLEDGVAILPAKATLDGMQVLGDHYPPGTPLDPLRIRFG